MPTFNQKSQNNRANPDTFLKTDHLTADLKGRSVRGGAATLVSQGFKFFIQMGSTAALARLLTPEDYGLVGMTSAVMGFVGLFQNMGLSEATVQQAEVTHKQVSTLFWINCLVGMILALLSVAISPLVANFYDEPRVIGIMWALSTTFIIGSCTVQHQALLKRQMQFGTIAKINIVSSVLSILVAIAAGWYGLGYWSLVLMFITSNFFNGIAVWLSCSWRPGVPDFNSGVGSMLAFGGNLVGFNCVNYFSRNLDNVLIGRVWGPQELGLYAKAYQLVLLPIKQINSPVTSVAMPALSRLQDDPAQYKNYYYKAVTVIAAIGMPIVCFLYAAAEDVILLILGDQWLGVVPIFRFLMPAAFVSTFGVATGWAFQSLGQTGRQFRLGIFTSIINISIFIFGVRWGAVGVAAAYGLTRPIMALVNITFCFRGNFLRTVDLLRTLSTPVFASIFPSLILMFILSGILSGFSIFGRLFVEMIIYINLYFLFWIIWPKNRKTFLEVIKLIKEIKGK